MTAIAVPMEIGIVLIELHMRAAETCVPAVCRALHDALSRAILRHQICEAAAFRRRVFRMGMVVVKPGTIRKNEVAFHFVERERPMRIDLGKLILLLVLSQTRHAEPAGVFVWIFAGIIPE